MYALDMLDSAKKPYHHGELREALLAAGESALAEMSIENVSLREIARRAGVSHAAPKHHFATLGELLAEIAARGFETFVSALEGAAARASDQSPSARLKAMSRAYLRFAADHPAVYGLMFGKREQCATTPHLAQASIAAWSQLEQEVRNIVGPGRASDGALLVWSTVHGLAMLRLDRKLPPNLDPSAALENVNRIMIAGLQADS
jgi:AcrR family transcriptional regulator